MKRNGFLVKLLVLTVSLALGVTLIWWRAKNEKGKGPQWEDTPENRARALAEARADGWVVSTTHSDGSKWYFMGSSKYMIPIRPEEIDYRWLWRDNQQAPAERRGKGTPQMGLEGEEKTYTTWKGEKVELKLTVDYVAPGTPVEELMKREGE